LRMALDTGQVGLKNDRILCEIHAYLRRLSGE
jgi:hypothetical protein